ARVAGDEGQIDLAANVGQQVFAQQAEQGAQEDDEGHADAQGVEQPALGAHQDGIDEVLHVVGSGNGEHGHEQGAQGSLEEQGLVQQQQAEKSAPGCDGASDGGGQA